MATHRIPILGFGTLPDTSGDIFPEPFDIKATNDVWKSAVWVFNDSGTDLVLYGSFTVPENYVGTAKIMPIWTSTAESGDVVWDFDYRAHSGDDTESLDQSGQDEQATVTDTAPSAALERLIPTITLTSGNFAAGDTVLFKFIRNGANGSDTMAAAALLFALMFEYADA
jgi:hypothetical protein